MLLFLAIYLRYNEVINGLAWLSSWLMNYMQRGRVGNGLPPVILHLLIINALVFLSFRLLKSTIDLSDLFSIYYPTSSKFRFWQPITHLFSHGGEMHLIFNMFALWMFGTPLARKWGGKRFIIFYLLCGLGAAAIMMGVDFIKLFNNVPVNIDGGALGASGAVYGVLAAFAYLFPNTTLMLIIPPIPMKAKYFVPILILIDLVMGLSNANSGVGHFAHVGGALVGFLLVLQMQKNRKTFY